MPKDNRNNKRYPKELKVVCTQQSGASEKNIHIHLNRKENDI
jgi:hypothetical protein